jgi:Cd2+/Zn2+-exporting ATPase
VANHRSARDPGLPENAGWKKRLPLTGAFAILTVMLILESGFSIVPRFPVNLVIYSLAWLLAGYNVAGLAWQKAKCLDFFNEFFLMTVATLGAFSLKEYSEGVAVMVFYSIGEWFQESAVSRARRSIKTLLDVRPDRVTVIRNDIRVSVDAKKVGINELIEIKPGEKVALDGILYSESAGFNTAALTGESKPDTRRTGESVLAGMICLDKVALVKVTSLFRDSKLSRILELAQEATANKSQTQLFISRFAKSYTPVVFALALAVIFLPSFFVNDYRFSDWFYRGLVFLVVSCPCALVVSIPLGYFGGIGLASRNGILFKGSNFLDVMTKVDMVVMDKTGTLTKGVFNVQEVVSEGIEKDQLIQIAAAIEWGSTHPVAKAITDYADRNETKKATDVEEIAGYGLRGNVEGKEILAGSTKLLTRFSVDYPEKIDQLVDTVVVLALNGCYAGYIIIADEIRDDARLAVERLHALNIQTVMLSGDKQSVVEKVAKALGIDSAFGNLLPEEKVGKLREFKSRGMQVAFAGDGVNDAPVVALADAGIAMGGLGSDATIETAAIVIQSDQPSKIAEAIRAGKITRMIVWQNIILAMTVKLVVLALGAGGVANLWEAVIADVGVALLAILNAVRIQQAKLDD